MRKPPKKVLTINGRNHQQDIIKQAELTRLGGLQAIAWQAEQDAHNYAAGLRIRLEHGASVESGDWYFDRELKMARKRKQEREA